jgi:predicted transcriptional regulator of viral defense system
MRARRILLAELARASSGGLLSVERAAEALGVSAHDAAVRLGRLERSGWLARARRGLYLVLPLEAKPGAAAVAEDPWVLAAELFEPCYIGGWTAAEHWGLTEQIFRPMFVVSSAPRRRQKESRLSTDFHIVRLRPERMEGAASVWRGDRRVSVSDRERTIIDGLVHPNWLGGVRHLSEILIAYRESNDFNAKRLVASAEEHATGAAFKRLGYLAERLWPDEDAVLEIARRGTTKGVIRLDPAIKSRGRMNKRWGLWINVRVEGAAVDS